jgi:hypothetical protein
VGGEGRIMSYHIQNDLLASEDLAITLTMQEWVEVGNVFEKAIKDGGLTPAAFAVFQKICAANMQATSPLSFEEFVRKHGDKILECQK